jgi:pilus assembly protein CpaE
MARPAVKTYDRAGIIPRCLFIFCACCQHTRFVLKLLCAPCRVQEEIVAQKILVVDDDRDSLKLIGLMLQRRGYQITVAQTGAQAMVKAEAESPDLIILDVMMPDFDGYEVCRRLRANPQTARLPIIMFTAKTQVTDKVAGFQAGADDYLTKPIHPAELTTRVEAMLARSARAQTEAAPAATAHTIGFVGAKGGVGTTTLAVNVAAAMAQPEIGQGKRVVMAELVNGGGTAGLQLGFAHPNGLATLIAKPVEELDQHMVESQLVEHNGVRMLFAPVEPRVSLLPVSHVEATVSHLIRVSDFLLLDLGCGLDSAARVAIKLCRYIVMVVESQRVALTLAQAMLSELSEMDVLRDRVGLVLFNRSPSAASISKTAVEGLLGEVVTVIPPASELAFQAAEVGVPIIQFQPSSLASSQIRDLAKYLLTK